MNFHGKKLKQKLHIFQFFHKNVGIIRHCAQTKRVGQPCPHWCPQTFLEQGKNILFAFKKNQKILFFSKILSRSWPDRVQEPPYPLTDAHASPKLITLFQIHDLHFFPVNLDGIYYENYPGAYTPTESERIEGRRSPTSQFTSSPFASSSPFGSSPTFSSSPPFSSSAQSFSSPGDYFTNRFYVNSS